jgi:peptidoglycan DL-endopeptidase CwlO
VVTLIATGVALVVGLGPATVAHATPSPQELEKQITDAWNKAEVAIEAYDGVHAQLLANQAKLTKLEAALNPLKLQMDLAYARVGVLSTQLYERGPGLRFNSLLSAGTPTVFIDDLSILDQMTKQQQATLADVKGKVDQYAAQKQPIDALVAKLKQQDALLAAQKHDIETQLSKLQQLRLALYGSSGGSGGSLAPVTCPQQVVGGKAATAVRYACAHVVKSSAHPSGYPYHYGSSGPNSFDCSGFTMAAWASAGVSLYHKASVQATEVSHVSSPQAGDLVFFNFGGGISHVGIYIGNGWMIHAPHSGDYVREAQVASVGGSVSYGRP